MSNSALIVPAQGCNEMDSSICLTTGNGCEGHTYPLLPHENSATVVAVASAGWWPLIGWLGLYHGIASTLLLHGNSMLQSNTPQRCSSTQTLKTTGPMDNEPTVRDISFN